MIYDVLLERVAHLIHIIHMHRLVVGVHLAATLIHRQEDWFDTAGGLCHKRCGTRRSDSKTCDVSATILHDVGIQFGICILYAQQEGIILLSLGIKHLECSSLLCHLHRRAVGSESKCLVNAHREIGGLLCAVSQSHGSNHVALGSDTHTGASAHTALFLDLLPQVIFRTLNLVVLRVGLYLCHDGINLLELQVNDVVHDSLSHEHMLLEKVEIKVCLGSEWIHHV